MIVPNPSGASDASSASMSLGEAFHWGLELNNLSSCNTTNNEIAEIT